MAEKKRFKYHMMVSVSDKVMGDAILINADFTADSKEEIFKGIEHEAKNLPKHFINRCVEPLTKEMLLERALEFRNDKKWGNRRIKNWFEKFGFEVKLPDNRVVNKSGQQNLSIK